MRRRPLPRWSLQLLALALAAAPAAAQVARGTPQWDYEVRRYRTFYECGQRHLELAVEWRDKGLVSQAVEQLALAVTSSEGLNAGAQGVLESMRSLDERFWKKRKPARPTPQRLEACAAKAAELRSKDLEDRLDLALWAWKKGLKEEARREFEGQLRLRDEPLSFDERGALITDGGIIPAEVAAGFRAQSVEINGRPYLRDEFLSNLPDLPRLFEKVSSRLRVRSTASLDQAEAMHALGSALLPALDEALGARPSRRLNVVLLSERRLYEDYLAGVGLSAHAAATGFADTDAFTAIVSTQGRDALEAQAALLHELAHLYHHGVTPTVMPAWHSEGFAETFGGEGTFIWSGGVLATGGLMARHRLKPLLSPAHSFGLEDLLACDPLALWTSDRERALAFYAESWAFLRFLRTGAGPEVAERLELWESTCRGSALGAEIRRPRAGSSAEAEALFRSLVGSDLPRLEADFRAWLARL